MTYSPPVHREPPLASPSQQQALAMAATDADGELVRHHGGFWTKASHIWSGIPSKDHHVGGRTVKACLDRGWFIQTEYGNAANYKVYPKRVKLTADGAREALRCP